MWKMEFGPGRVLGMGMGSKTNAAKAVDSWPPPWEAVLMKTPTYLPQRPPDCQRPPVWSQNAFHWAGKLP